MISERSHSVRIGLVLGGGGAKGAYQIGVYRALVEMGVEQFEYIAGTSIGSLNALLIATNNPKEAVDVWKEIGGVLHTSRVMLHAVLFFGLTYGAMFLPLICSLVFGVIYAYAEFSAYFQPPGNLQLIQISLLSLVLSGCGVLIMGHQARTFHYAGFTLAFTFNPLIFFWGAIGPWVALTWLLPIRTSYSLAFILGWSAAAIAFWLALSFLVAYTARRARTFALFDNSSLEQLLLRYLAVPENLWRSAKIFATIARERRFFHPAVPISPESEYLKEAIGQKDQPGGLLTQWVPEYVDLRASSVERRLSTFLTTAAIPVAFPMFRDGKEWRCDGGIIDNLPVTAAVNLGTANIVVVISLNKNEMPQHHQLQDHVDEKWSLAVIPNMTAPEKRALYEKAQASHDGLWMHLVPGRRLVDHSRIVVIEPSRPLCTVDLPLLRFFTGTLNFDKRSINDWIELGYHDAKQKLKDRLS